MIIEKISVTGLFGKTGETVYDLNADLNVITGRNGSGKTTILKLAWFIVSGNIIHALQEVSFRVCTIKTDLYTCTVLRTGKAHCKVTLERNGDVTTFEDDVGDPEEHPFFESAEDKVRPHLVEAGSSIFFPTFRRIEGGFSLPSESPSRIRATAWGTTTSDVDDVLSSLSRKLSNNEHIFVAAISTQDIVGLLLRRYARFSEEINSYQEQVSRSVIEKIKHYESSQGSQTTADSLLSETREEIERIEQFRSETMSPLDAVRGLVEKLFQHSGISFGKRLSFGDAAAAVNSDKLSAGEKQMLSFICYNAFYSNTVVFIDEPELSLHVDWQRQLYPILKSQNSQNQFIFATHSPFIYGKYPDKEMVVGMDRGD
ncbi:MULTISPECIES: AAA family ATPase [Rhizobium]|uniref:AAA family ATPase n=1 Tax=Rhizobium TaxID=379 RepID=UPI00040EE60A|nr:MULTISPECIES: ATP-binding protein [Rhizobium]MCS0460401.1 AAA family ATPase [Rhizobium favelukesii]UFS80795.1 AAA family ATPase [Rhizobium sp. T136]